MMNNAEESRNINLVRIVSDVAKDGNTYLHGNSNALIIGPKHDNVDIDKYLGKFVRCNGKRSRANEHATWCELPASLFSFKGFDKAGREV